VDGFTFNLLFAREEVMLSGWTDRVYLGPGPPAIQVEGAKGATLELTSTNLPDTVLWNPWHKVVFFSYTGSSNCSLHNELPRYLQGQVWNFSFYVQAAEMSDLGEEAWPGFLCVEAGQVDMTERAGFYAEYW
jgi:D-hexose-6-phosphate mutarotase